MRRILRAGLVLAFSAGFYLLLIDTVSPPEFYVLLAVSILAVVAFEISVSRDLPKRLFAGIGSASSGGRWPVRRAIWRSCAVRPSRNC